MTTSSKSLTMFINSSLRNLKVLVRWKVGLVESLKIKLKSLRRKLRSLKALYMFTTERCIELDKINDFFILSYIAAHSAAYLSHFCLVDEMDEEMVNKLVFDLSALVGTIDPETREVRKFYIRVLEACLEASPQSELSSKLVLKRGKINLGFVKSLLENVNQLQCVSWTVPVRDQIRILELELKLLEEIIRNSMHSDPVIFCDLLKHIKVIFIKAGSLVYSLYDNKMNKEIAEKMYSWLVDFLVEIYLLKVEKIELLKISLDLELNFMRLFELFGTFEGYDDMDDLLMNAIKARSDLQDLDFCMDGSIWHLYVNGVEWLQNVKLVNSKTKEVYRETSSSTPSNYVLSQGSVIDFITSLLENLKLLNSVKVDRVVPLKIKLEALEGKLGSLRTVLMLTEGRWTDRELDRAKFVANEAAYLTYSSALVGEMDEDMVDTTVSDISGLLLEVDQLYISRSDEINFEVLESLRKKVLELLSAGLPDIVKDKSRIFQQELALLGSFIKDPPNLFTETQILDDLLEYSRNISSKAVFMVHLLYNKEKEEETIDNVSYFLVDLLEEIKLFKVMITEIYIKFPKPPFPMPPSTGELGFFDCLRDLTELLNHRSYSITCYSLGLLVESVVGDFQSFRSFLTRSTKQHTKKDELKILRTQIINVASEVHYIFDSLLVGNGPIWHLVLWFDEAKKEIEILKAKVYKLSAEMSDSEIHSGEENSYIASLEATSSEMNDVSVEFEDEEKSLVEHLLGEPKKLQVAAIVGMAGLGKTHLAKRIFNNTSVKGHFDVRTWCYVSQEYNKKHLLTSILSQVAEPMSEMEDEELAAELYRRLKGKRYLILMDDVWDIEPWVALRRSFPDDNCRSRIIFTSRFHNLNLEVPTKTFVLRLFTDDESWQLLQKKLFQSESCPSELLEVGKQISKYCNGLPLSVTLVAGILARIDKNQSQWIEVANCLSLYLVDDPEKKSIKVIELSYVHMPDYLKPCFLYFSAFIHKKHIRVQKLIHLWVAEGFIQNAEEKSLEDIAEQYLMHLVGRSLVMIAERRSTGGIKKCYVHDLVRDFCVKKVEEENFFQLIKQSFDLSRYTTYEQRRICCNEPTLFLNSLPLSQCFIHFRSLLFFDLSRYPHIRSLLFFDCTPAHYPNVSSIFHLVKLLNVLDLGYILLDYKTFPNEITSLCYLRYLAVCGNFDSIPSSIADLESLETFIVKRICLELALPDTIWKLVNLRHLCIKYGVVLNLSSCSHVSRLNNLQTVSNLILACEDDTEELLKGLSNVKKLKCIFLKSWDSSRIGNQLPVLNNLIQLESLNVRYKGRVLQNYMFSFPSSIKKLTLSYFCCPWQQISIIGELPNLEVLKLLYDAFQGDEWEMGDGEFPKLKFLKLRGLDLTKWSVSSDQFPPLEHLVLQSCRKLEEIPYCLADIATLKMIEVSWCNSTLEELVKQIQEEQQDFGNELKVVFHHIKCAEGSNSEEGSFYSSVQEAKPEEDPYHSSAQHTEQDSEEEEEEDMCAGYFYDSEE